jgi:hypothetical protein
MKWVDERRRRRRRRMKQQEGIFDWYAHYSEIYSLLRNPTWHMAPNHFNKIMIKKEK